MKSHSHQAIRRKKPASKGVRRHIDRAPSPRAYAGKGNAVTRSTVEAGVTSVVARAPAEIVSEVQASLMATQKELLLQVERLSIVAAYMKNSAQEANSLGQEFRYVA